MENEINELSNEIDTNNEQNDVQEVEQITKDWVELNQKKNLRGSHKGNKGVKLLITLLVILLLLAGGGFTYFKFFKPDAQDIYVNLVKKYGNKTSKRINDRLKRSNDSYLHEGNISIDSDMDDYKILSQLALEYSIGAEPKLNTLSSAINYKEKNKDILKGNIYIKDDKIYIKSDQISSKLLYINNKSKNNSINSLVSEKDTEDIKYLTDKINEYLQKALSKAEYKTEYGRINTGNKKVLVQKNIMSIDTTNANDIKDEFLINLRSDEKCIKTIAKYYGQDSKDIVTEINKRISEKSKTKPLMIELDTGIINNKLASFKITEDSKERMSVINTAHNLYKIIFYDKGTESITGTVKINHENNIAIETKYKDYKYYLKLVTNSDQTNIKYDVKVTDKNDKYLTISGKNNTNYNNKIVLPKLDGATDIEKLSDSEMQEIEKNTQKIYESSDFLTSITSKEENEGN